jgi:diacylglycerol kinase
MNPPRDADRETYQGFAHDTPRSLYVKFRSAFRGLGRGLRGERNFRFHGLMTAAVLAAGWLLDLSKLEWCLLALCIGGVLAAEMFNTALEMLARAITRDYDANVEDALDTSSAAVLIVSGAAAVVGAVILGCRFGSLVGWW